MYFLNNLKDFNIYKNRTLVGIDPANKDIKRGTGIIFAANTTMDIVSLLESRILYGTNYRSYYIPFKYTTMKLKKVKSTNQKEIYDKIRKSTTLSVFKKTPTQYKGLNLIYDLSYESTMCMSEISVKGQNYIKAYLNFLENRISNIPHKNKIVAIPVPNNTDIKDITLNNLNSSLAILMMAIRKKLMTDAFNGVTFIVYTDNGTYFKFTYSNELKPSIFNKSFARIISASNSKDVEEDEIPVEDNSSVNKIVNSDVKITNVRNTILNKLGIDVKASKGIVLSQAINSLDELLTNKLNSMNVAYDNMTEEDILVICSTEPEIVQEVDTISDIATKGITEPAEVARLKKKQSEVIFDGKKLEEIFNEAENLSIDRSVIDNENILNEEVKKNTTHDFDKSYHEKQMKKDIANILTAFNNDPDIPLYVKSIDTENTSDSFTKKMTYTIKFEDANKVQHTMKLNYPILKDGKFMLVNGGKKLLLKQLMLLPIVKTKPDTVQISTNYNKLFITRFGQKLNDGTENIKKFFSSDLNEFKLDGSRFTYKRGNALLSNKGYLTSLEYGELSKMLINIEDINLVLDFEQKKLKEVISDELSQSYKKSLGAIIFDKERFSPIGYTKDNKWILLADVNSGEIFKQSVSELIKVKENLTFFIVEEILKKNLRSDKISEFYTYGQARTLTYNRMRITGRTIPIIIALAYEQGLTDILKRYNVEYEFTTATRVINKFGQKKIKFLDGFLLYNSMDLKTTLLLDGLTNIDTSSYAFDDMDTKLPYIEYFFEQFGSRNVGKGLHNMLSLMMDPITVEICQNLKLPTNIIDLILHANTMLASSTYKNMNDMSCYRVRGAEQINAVMYQVMANAFKTYKDTSNNGTPIKISTDPDMLLKKLMSEKTVDEYSILNPSLEIDKMSAATFKGPSGINLDDAYTTDIRSYSQSMQGVLAMSSPNSDKIGVVRQLSYDPKIVNLRGFIDPDQSSRNGSTNINCPTELLNSFTSTHADPARIGMQITQQKHCIPVQGQTKPLFGSGVDKALPYLLSDDFVFVAEEDGILESIDTQKEIAIIKYASGKKDIIDISEIVSKNSNGGFYVANQKELLFKQGQKFKKNDVLAKNPNYFKGNDPRDVTYSTGRLCKIAVANLDATMEDSSMITQKMSTAMTTKMTMRKEVVLGPNANLEFIIEKGAKVKTGDNLVVFDTSFEDDSLNILLGGLEEEINELTKNKLTSKYTGRIVDVMIYYNKDIEEYSPSLQKLITGYVDDNVAKNDEVMKTIGNESLRLVNTKQITKVNDTKIKGIDVDGLLIEIFIEYEDNLAVGDKVTYGTALKTIVCDVFNKGEEPFSDFKPEEEVDAIFPPCSIVNRMTLDFYFHFYLNKALLALKEDITDIWNS